MKVLTVTVLLIAFYGWTTEGSRCFRRREKVLIAKMKYQMACEMPVEQLVALPVPKGYDYVVPSMAKVNRCSGMLCWGMNQGCKETKYEMKKIKVEAKGMNDLSAKCTHVRVREHKECGCGCILKQEHCQGRKVLDEEQCACVCPREEEENCMRSNGVRMWSKDTCSCTCTLVSTCPEGSTWIDETCSCMKTVQE